ncbi:MAG TPA: respiratory nitrate reductase subunit gamma [Candidatus Acidoferrum sp.]|nr:respiratory nitrate reductase subunit gamma [Candidatus Acidoferrum sp.]
MTLTVYVAIYAGLLLFLFGCVRRIWQYARTPVHLRWELYPVPHEEPDRVAHGGSYFETSDWASKPRHANRIGELRVMIPEMLFLKGLWEFNRRLWVPSFLFHFGLYLLIGTAVLIAFGAGVPILVPSLASSSVWIFLAELYHVTAYAGAALSVLGALLLMSRRATDTELKNYTKPADFFNLLFFIVAFALVAAGYAVRSPGSAGLGELARGLLRFDSNVRVSGLFGVGLILSAALAAYVPFTHMAHFIAKYFTYHSVRWDDRPNVRGGSIEAAVAQYLTYRPTWSAEHVGADGKKSWVDIATTNPAQEVRK